MKIYLLTHGDYDANKMKVRAFFFKRSAIVAAERERAECGEWFEREDSGDRVAYWETRAGSRWMSVSAHYLRFWDWSFMRWLNNHAHWQNLSTDRDDKPKESILKYGRAWFRPFGYGHKRQFCIGLCWHFGGGGMRWFGVGMRLFDGDSERDIAFRLGLWRASFYLTLEDILPMRFGYPRHSWNHDTSIEISADGGCDGPYVSIDLYHAGDDCFDCKGWKGKHWYWWPLNTLLGKPVYASKPLTERPAVKVVHMPEASYPVTVVLTEDTWKRPRWPWPVVVRRAQIECAGGIPTPGKGENSYDCGEDAAYSMTLPARDVDEALAQLRNSVLETRSRYGGANWRPEAMSKV